MEVQVYKPSMEDDGGGGGGSDQRFDRAAAEMMTVGQCQYIGDMDDSQLVGAPALVTGNEPRAEVKVEEKSSGKKRRGRPPGVHARTKTTPLKRKNEEEDVCFICFDGGSLVLCDRRGCPKAYHPACIKRDEAFFKSKAKWNCGWHICSSCQKAAHYMCYTCTYSLCKGCIKDADYQCIRGGSKGFCGTCMRTIMLIENAEGNKEAVQVDFDDKSSWEYLFKVYWMLLKEQFSLTLDDLVEAKNPWKDAAVMACKGVAPGSLYVDNKTKDSDSPNSCVDMEASISSGSNKKPKISDGRTPSPEGTIWASKELLEFVAHMNNGDVSVLSQFDVQALLLEYIKKNNLRDPHRKCQIICDLRLRKIFGKECVGHFEMLKLLEYHFLIKETSTAENINGAGATEMEIDGNYDNLMMMGSDKRRKTRRKMDERGPHSNADAYAAIDVHNIKLIYLPRNLIETLIDDADKFHEKVVGSIVRMRVSSSDQKQDTYRLVQIIGTNKVAEGYKIGKRTIDVKLEILNLDKKEVISINEVSNQAFSQDECKRLRQSIRCGLIKRFTVGEIQDKAMALRAIRVNEELEAELLRLSHLRDRASEKGHRKELREFVEKLQLLDSPKERQRRLHEIPEVHSDSKMDPSYESDNNAGESEKKQDDTIKPSKSVIGRKGREPFSPRRKCGIPNNTGSKAQKNQGREAFGTNGWNITSNQANITGLVPCVRNSESATGSNTLFEFASEISSVSASLGMNNNLSDESFETEKIWHYQDPTGKIQGPFAMVQLCKWSTTGAFPADHRIWRTNENQDESILLTDALNGHYYKEPPLTHGSKMRIQGFTVPLDEGNNCHVGWKKSLNATVTHDKQIEESLNTNQDGQSLQKTVDTELVRSSTTSDTVNTNEKQTVIHGKQIEESRNTKQEDQSLHKSFAAELVRSTTPVDVANTNEEQTGILLQTCDSLKGNNSPPNQPQDCTSLTSPVLPVKPFETLSHEEGEGRAENNSDHKNEDVDHRQCNENRSDSEGQSGQSSGQNWRPPNANSPSNGFDSNSDFVPVTKSLMTSEQDEKILALDFPSPPPKPSNEDLRGQAAEIKQFGSSDVPVQDVGPSWSSSNLVACGEQLHKVAGEWGGYSPTPAKLSIEEWDSNLMSTSSLKPNEMASDCVSTPVSVSGQLTEPISSHHTSNASGWHAILAEANAFCTLAADESVSDLLAEVEAMESLSGLATPTSIMNCGGEFTEGSKNDSISSVEGFSPAHEPGKGDALSSTCDLQLSFQPMVIDETPGACHTNVLDLQQRHTVDASTMAEVQENRKPNDVSINSLEANVLVDQLEAGEIQNTAPSKECWDLSTTDNSWKARLESTDTNLEAVHGNAGVSRGGLQQQREDGLDLQQRPGLHSSTSAELEGYRKPRDISVNKLEENVSINQLDLEPGEIPTTAPAKESWDTSSTDNAWKARLESTETSSEADIGNEHIGWGGSDRGGANMGRGGLHQGIANVGRGGSYQGTANMAWRGGQGTIPGNSIMNSGTLAGGLWEGQSRYGGDRLGPRDRGFQNRGLGRGRFVGNRPAPYGNANGGGSFRPPQKGQRVCKYFESGYCKKGAACSYFHP